MTTVILAPHIDDELIGCFTPMWTLKDITVVFFYDLTDERVSELRVLKEKLVFDALFNPPESDVHKLCEAAERVYVPSRKDAHAHHKAVNALYRHHATHFYSVDMVDATPLNPGVAKEKKAGLDVYYPSQAALWERDHKYFLFESIHEKDYDVYVDLGYITCLEEYASAVHDYLERYRYGKSGDVVFNDLLKICTRGSVELKVDHKIYRT